MNTLDILRGSFCILCLCWSIAGLAFAFAQFREANSWRDDDDDADAWKYDRNP